MNIKKHCILCGREIDTLRIIEERPKIVPYTNENGEIICEKCVESGWTFCIECKKAFNINKVKYDEFYIYKDISDAQSKFIRFLEYSLKQGIEQYSSINKNEFCCNKEYNLKFWAEEIKSQVNLLLMEDVMGISELMTPLPGGKPLKRFNNEELEQLSKYVDNKIEYIKNNL